MYHHVRFPTHVKKKHMACYFQVVCPQPCGVCFHRSVCSVRAASHSPHPQQEGATATGLHQQHVLFVLLVHADACRLIFAFVAHGNVISYIAPTHTMTLCKEQWTASLCTMGRLCFFCFLWHTQKIERRPRTKQRAPLRETTHHDAPLLCSPVLVLSKESGWQAVVPGTRRGCRSKWKKKKQITHACGENTPPYHLAGKQNI